MVNILKNVEINELIKITVFNPNMYSAGQIAITLDAIEEGKRVVIDPDAAMKLNEILKERANNKFESIKDPKMKKDMEEFVARMCIEWHKNGLLIIEDIPDAPSDPFEEAKKAVQGLARRQN